MESNMETGFNMPSYHDYTADDLYLMISDPDELQANQGLQAISSYVCEAYGLPASCKYNTITNDEYMKWLHINAVIMRKYYDGIGNQTEKKKKYDSIAHVDIDNVIKIMSATDMNPNDADAVRFLKTIDIDDDCMNDDILMTMMNPDNITITYIIKYMHKVIQADRWRRDNDMRTWNADSVVFKVNMLKVCYAIRMKDYDALNEYDYYNSICKIMTCYPANSQKAMNDIMGTVFNDEISETSRVSMFESSYKNSLEMARARLEKYKIDSSSYSDDVLINGLHAYDVILEIMSTAVNYSILFVEDSKGLLLTSITAYNALLLQVHHTMNNAFTLYAEQYADMMKHGSKANDDKIMILTDSFLRKEMLNDDIPEK